MTPKRNLFTRAAAILFSLLLAACVPGAAAAVTARAETDEDLQRVLAEWVAQSIEEGKETRALDIMRIGVALFPDNPNTYALRAQIHERMGRVREALEDYDRAVSMAPDDPLFRASRGALYASLGDLGTARDDLDRAIEIGGADPETFYYRGLHYMALQQYDGAERDFDDAIKQLPFYPEAQTRRALCRYITGRLDAARADLEAVLKVTPDSPEALNLYAIVLSTMGDVRGGIAALETARKADPKFSGVYVNLGYSEFLLGNTRSAFEYFRKSLEAEPENAYALCNLAEMQIHGRAWADARPLIDRCLRQGRADLGFWRELRRYLRGMRRAADYLNEGADAGFDFAALVKEGDAAFEDGDYERAYTPYALALMLDLTDPHLLYRMGLTSLYLEELYHAAGFFYQLIRVAPDDPLAAKARFQLDRMGGGR